MLAYSLLTLSALHAIFMGFTERALHNRAQAKSQQLAATPHHGKAAVPDAAD
jgi:ABC-type uncharacterized transport system permease subunit